jgi:Transmembrane amino acid transporter protein
MTTMNNTRTIHLLLLSFLLVLTPTTAEFIPKKSWAVIGYEAFNSKEAVSTAGKNAKKSKQLAPAESLSGPTSAGTKKKSRTSDVAAASGPSGGTKVLLGFSLATLFAILGGKALANEAILPERALVESLNKHVVARTVPVPLAVAKASSTQGSSSTSDGATIPNEIFNLVKAIVGVGVLSLPAGVAAFGSAPSAFIPGVILIAVIGMLSAYGFSLIGRVCAYTGAKSYREAWSKTIGEGSSWIPAWSTTCKVRMRPSHEPSFILPKYHEHSSL